MRRTFVFRSRTSTVATAAAISMFVSQLVGVAAPGPVQDPVPPSQQAASAQPAPVGCRVTGLVTSMMNAPARPNFGQGRGFGGQGAGAGAQTGRAGQAGRGGQAGQTAQTGQASQTAQAGQAGAASATDPATQSPATPPTPTLISTALPGATIVVHQGARLVVATSTDIDGKFAIRFTPGQTFHVAAEAMGFGTEEKDLTLAETSCDTTLNFELKLRPRTDPIPTGEVATGAAGATGATGAAGASGATGAPGAKAGAATAAPATPGFTQLNVKQDATGAAAVEAGPPVDQSAELAKFLPPGFSVAGANAEAVSVSGGGDAMSVDRSLLNDRMNAIGRGEFDPATGQFAPGFGPPPPPPPGPPPAVKVAAAAGLEAVAAEVGAARADSRSAGAGVADRIHTRDRPPTPSTAQVSIPRRCSRATA